jgi:hypothetical protein
MSWLCTIRTFRIQLIQMPILRYMEYHTMFTHMLISISFISINNQDNYKNWITNLSRIMPKKEIKCHMNDAIQLCSKVCMEGCNHISLVKTSFSYGTQYYWWPTSITNKGCVTLSLCHFAIYIKKYLKAKEEELWKLKYFTMQKYNLSKILQKKPKSFKIL